jgi:hypothetical protein
MLPLGRIRFGKDTRFTRDEQRTLLTLWCIARSPLIHGGDLTQTDDFTLSLLTNPEVIAVNQDSSGNRELFHRDGLIGWVADVPSSADKYVALFNTSDLADQKVAATLKELGLTGRYRVRDLWVRADMSIVDTEFATNLPAHGAGLYRLTPVK